MVVLPWDGIDFYCFLAIFLFVAIHIGKIHWSLGLAFAATLLCGVLTSDGLFYRQAPLAHYNYIRLVSMQSLATFFLIFIAAEKINIKSALRLFVAANTLNSVLVIYEFIKIHDGFASGGFLINSSMNSSFIACTMAFCQLWLLPVFLSAVFCAKASVPIAVAATVLLFRFAKRKQIIYAVLIAIGTIYLGYHLDKDFLNGSGRFENWKASMIYWTQNINKWIGGGSGTYRFSGSVITEQRKIVQDLRMQAGLVWGTMHNEFLQVVFESGYIGITSVAILLGHAFWYCRKNSAVFSALAGYCVFSFFNMPLRYVPTALFGAIILRASFGSRNEQMV